MITLSYGFLKPEDSDNGAGFFPAMAENIQKLNDHTHDGQNSALLINYGIAVPASEWTGAPIGGGVYRQILTLPDGYAGFDTTQIWFRDVNGNNVSLDIERIDSSTFYVYTNNISLDYNVYYR